MADQIKVQGSVNRCLDVLKMYANQYGVTYIAYFPQKGNYRVKPNRRSLREISVYFNWSFEYKEYDNSV